ncbi:hypothetical protein [Streptomyces sp. NPDC048611]|uniref:hypothetical protein n=1 Tax=Streptomyces sp. NPDC048611 TaxID=3155635 RepID=UPI0034245895
MRPHLPRFLVAAALGGAGVLAVSGAAQAASAPVQRASGDGPSLVRPLFGGQFDPVAGMGGGVISGGGRPVATTAGR